jgi:hypothetical protein
MVKLTRKEAEYIVAAGAAIDFLTEGKFTKAVSRRVKAAARRAGPTVARTTASTAARLGGTALRVGKTVALRHPVLTGGAVVYYAYKNRDELGELVEQGYEIAQDLGAGIAEAQQLRREEAERRPSIIPGVPAIIGRSDPIDVLGLKKPKRRRSSYNKAVSSAMKAVKKSRFLGKPGKLSSPKKAFATVNRTVSRVKKGAKVSAKGVSGVIRRAVRRIL